MTEKRFQDHSQAGPESGEEIVIGKVLEGLLREHRLTYRELAEELGIPKSTLS